MHDGSISNDTGARARLLLGILGAAALLLGIGRAGNASGGPPYLVQMHLHGSLSEGTSTMRNHVQQARLHGYDGLWWTDHAERQLAENFQHYVPFEGDLLGRNELRALHGTPCNTGFELVEPLGGAGHDFVPRVSGRPALALAVGLRAAAASPWRATTLRYFAQNGSEHKSLLAEPHVVFDLRQEEGTGDAGLAVRVTLSSQPDGVTLHGEPRVIEFRIGDGVLPAPEPGVVRVDVPVPARHGWSPVDLDLRAAAESGFALAADLAMTEVSFELHARDGGRISVGLDEFRLLLAGPTGSGLLRAQRDLVQSQAMATPPFQHVGTEVSGPSVHHVRRYSTRDHLLALFDEPLPASLPLYAAGSRMAEHYPRSGVEWIHAHGGVAVLAHVFGAFGEESGRFNSSSNAAYLADRIVAEAAWGADAMEVGYPLRGRPLAEHVAVWDRLSGAGIYVTGVGTSDNHNVLPWDRKTNRWASWVDSTGESAAELQDAVRGGDLFFGDPHVFDVDGDLVLREEGGGYRMGDVVPIAGGTERLSITVGGARSGDELVVLVNGAEVLRRGFQGPSLSLRHNFAVQPGDWLRVEVRDAADAPYLYSNPVYYVDSGVTPPPHRAP